MHARDRFDQRGFSGGIRPKQPHDSASAQRLRREVFKDVARAVPSVQVFNVQRSSLIVLRHVVHQFARFLVMMMRMKNGTPMTAVMMPIGIASPGRIINDTACEHTSTSAPEAMDAGMK